MNSTIQIAPLLVGQLELTHGSTPVHKPNQYELILIQRGRGEYVVNGNPFAYQAGNVFYLTPADRRSFMIFEETSFYSLSFTTTYLASLMSDNTGLWPHIHAYPVSFPGTVIPNPIDRRNLLTLVQIMLTEQQGLGPQLDNPVLESLMKTVLSLLDRHLAQYSSGIHKRSTALSGFVQRIVAYIDQHITEPDLLRMDKLADSFNYSASHLAALFKQQVGESIQRYIIRYKLKQVETKLSLSTMTISQIADEFGFADVCHLNKLFKQYYHHTPTNYRRSLALL